MRDTDSVDNAERLRVAAWSAFGGVLGGIAGALLFGFAGFVAGWVLAAGLLYVVAMQLADRAGRLGSMLYLTSGSTTPAVPDYSLGDSLAARGRLTEAAAEFERCTALCATDPAPRFRLARLLRDRTHDPEAAARWLRSILDIPLLDAATEALAARELAELFVHGMDQPARALAVLARLAARQPATAAGQWARARIAEIKAGMDDPS